MRHFKTGLVLASFGALALAGCGDKSETTTTTTTTTITTAADAAPVRKAGLWEQTTNAEGLGTATVKICLGTSVAPCAGAKVVKTADGYTVSATCKTPTNGTVAVEGAAKGDLSSAYTLTTTTTISGAPVPEMNRTTNATVSLRYLAACPDGMSVGQMQMDEGAVIDMSNFDAAKARAMAEAAGK
jgi:hypothetical protein